QTRKPASVLPDPVGAATSVSVAAATEGQPRRWASVGPSGKRRRNHSATAGWNAGCASAAVAAAAGPGRGGGGPPPLSPAGGSPPTGRRHRPFVVGWRVGDVVVDDGDGEEPFLASGTSMWRPTTAKASWAIRSTGRGSAPTEAANAVADSARKDEK